MSGSNEYESKFDEIKNFLRHAEKKARTSRWISAAGWSLVTALFIGYALWVPAIAKEVLSDTNGPRILTVFAKNYVPTSDEIVAKAKKEIPRVIDWGFDTAESYIPVLEEKVFSEFDHNADITLEAIERLVKEHVTRAAEQDLPKIKSIVNEIKDGDAAEQFSAYISDRFMEHVSEHVEKMDQSLDQVQARLEDFKHPKSRYAEKELSEKRLLLSLLRLAQEPAVKETARKALGQGDQSSAK